MIRPAWSGLIAMLAVALLPLALAGFGVGAITLAGAAAGPEPTAHHLSAEAPLVDVPELRGESLDAAREILAEVGLAANPNPPDAGGDWIVIRQLPAAGKTAPSGDEVEVFLQPPVVEPGATDGTVEPDEPGADDIDLDPAGLLGPIGAVILVVVGFAVIRRLTRGSDEPDRDERPRAPRIRTVSHPDRAPAITMRERHR